MPYSRNIFELTEQEGPVLTFQNSTGRQARILVLEDNIVRVLMHQKEGLSVPRTWVVAPGMEDVPFEGRDKMDLSPYSLPDYQIAEDKETNSLTLETPSLKLIVQLDGFLISWFRKAESGDWESIAADRNTGAYNTNGQLGNGVYHYMKRELEEKYYGLGEKTGQLNRHGRRYRMKNMDPMGYDSETTDPLYKHVPFYITKTETGGSYGILYDNLSTTTFDLGNEMDNYHGFYRYYHAESGDLDYYFILGAKIADVVENYTWLTGKTVMGPKWSLGYSGSTMTYTDADDAQDQMMNFIRDVEKYDIPCDSFQLSSGYTSIGNKRYVFNWNKDKFSDPEKFTADYQNAGVKLCANIKPALLIDHPMYEEAKEKGLFIKDPSGEREELIQFWDDLGAYLDFTNPETIHWWKEKVKEQLLSKGIDSTWNDNNEYEVWNNDAVIHGFGSEMKIGDARPVQPLLMMKASFEAQKEFNSQDRPYLISRSGAPGMQRYAQTWTGDNRTNWKTLKYNIKTGLGLSLSGIYNFGHDVGGFAGDAPEPELFIRWIQNGIFHPRFTIHSWNDDKTVNVPWMYPEYIQPIQNLMKFRGQLIPYVYHLLYRAHAHYEPILRPTFYNFENDLRTFEESDEFMLGEDMLVVTVTEENVYQKEVYLPAGAKWYDFATEIVYDGGQTVTVAAPLERPAALVREGAVIPFNQAEQGFNKKQDERLLCFYPHIGSGSTEKAFYEDDGFSEEYKDGGYSFIKVKMESSPEEIHIETVLEGSYTPEYSNITLRLPAGESRTVIINGIETASRETILSINEIKA